MSVATPTSNAEHVRRWFEEVWGQRRAEVVDEMLTAESVCYAEQGPVVGIDDFKHKMYFPLLGAFPDLRIFIDETLESGNQVVVRWRAEGTHTADALGFPATGRTAKFEGITWVRVQNGKLAEGWQSSNIPCVLKDLAEAKK